MNISSLKRTMNKEFINIVEQFGCSYVMSHLTLTGISRTQQRKTGYCYPANLYLFSFFSDNFSLKRLTAARAMLHRTRTKGKKSWGYGTTLCWHFLSTTADLSNRFLCLTNRLLAYKHCAVEAFCSPVTEHITLQREK